MAKSTVEVDNISRRKKTLNIYARDEGEAEEKAVDLVLGWDGVDDAEVTDVTRED